MLINTLTAPLKDNAGVTLLDSLVSGTTDGCILLATSQTVNTLAANEALFYDGASASISSRRTAGTLDSSLIGVYGTLIVDDGAVIGMLPSGNVTESYVVTRADSTGIQTSTQALARLRAPVSLSTEVVMRWVHLANSGQASIRAIR